MKKNLGGAGSGRATGKATDIQAALGVAMRHQAAGRLPEAASICRKVLRAAPDSHVALHLLGHIAERTGKFESAAELFTQALASKPDDVDVHCGLGGVLKKQGKLDDAVVSYQNALAIDPDSTTAHYSLAGALKDLGRLDDAVASYRQALQLKPDYVEAHSNLGTTLNALGRPDEALECYRQAVAVRPDHPALHSNLGVALKDMGKLNEAMESFQQALAISPETAALHNNLGDVLLDLGQLDNALACYRRALAIEPDFAAASSNLLFCLNYSPAFSPAQIGDETRAWAARLEAKVASVTRLYTNPPVADRRLRIGYVSPDFRQHSVAYFLEPVLGAHDRAAFEIFCYAEVEKPDDVTARMQRFADHWCDTSGMTEEELARRIAADEIDILVDLAGHTRGNRLPVFARRPAPVQVTWLGYCNTTGLDAIGYRLTDAVADPDGDETYSERLHRLPNGFLCYAPPAGTAEIAPPAALANSYVTFGSFNNLAKMTPDVVALWARILNAVPDAHLLLKSRLLAEEATQDQIAGRFADRGVARTRLVLLPRIETTDGHLEAYGRMDIALDPFPYNGTTTTCEALWMGRPVLTLGGDRHAARVSTSILTRCGLEHLIAGSEDAYVEKAIALAGDLTALQTMGSEMRGRMTGTLCNAALITADIEAAYRDMWRTWCAG